MTRGKVFLLCLLLCGGLFFGLLAFDRLPISATAAATTSYQELQLFTDVLSIVRRSYVEEVPIKDLIYGAIDGMLLSLDPHSGFMPPELYSEMKLDTLGQFGGLGIEITLRDGILTVVAPIEDTPAARAGLAPADQILRIEGQLTKDMEIMEAVRLMRGEPGSSITITVMRESFDKPRDFTLIREVIKVKSVKASMLQEGYGYIRLAQFQERSSQDMAKALAELHNENQSGLKGLILDLRNNPGGLLDQAVAVVDLFLREGLIVYTKGREAEAQMEFSAKPEGTEPDYPLIVLINGGSASASEIVAGALQDHERAVILGSQSFGKGSVQTIIPLSDDSGLRLTTARYFTPRGTSIQAMGITPDIEVLPGEVKAVVEMPLLRESDLKRHIGTETGNNQNGSIETPIDDKFRDDYQLMRALDLLKGWQIFQSMQKDAA
jgi:carboxyl-terminal processing protease